MDCPLRLNRLTAPETERQLSQAGLGPSQAIRTYRGKEKVRTRAVELAFRNFLEHRHERVFPPDNFLRGTGRDRSLPKRHKEIPQLHILEDTCPSSVQTTLRKKPPPGMKVVFYKQQERSGSPSRFHSFRRQHSPNIHLKLQKNVNDIRPMTAPDEKLSKYVVTQLGDFDKKLRTLAGIPEPGTAPREGAVEVAKRRRSSQMTQRDSLVFPKGIELEDPCECCAVVTRLSHLLQDLKKRGIVRLASKMTLTEAKCLFSQPDINHDQFMNALIKKTGDPSLTEDLSEGFKLMSNLRFDRNSTDSVISKDIWIACCHFLWRHYFGDVEAVLKTVFLVLSQRAAADSGDSAGVTRADLQILLSSYRIKKHANPIVTESIKNLITTIKWDDDAADFVEFEKAVIMNDTLKAAFIGHCDDTFVYNSKSVDFLPVPLGRSAI
eukprot:TRINITY_DN24738_c0_g1_i1.p1 TRINITY_DN24738_c0_g1~~TRINITY_DN24738_c0_g1_i1.p1  ORF type:complete len:436 (+),score=94.82 TRINITY_DN24738_c0_g1_i1:76-1383(+)